MDSNDFAILTGRLEREADSNPQLHLAKVAAVAALGYLPIALFAVGGLIALISLIRSEIVAGHAPAFAVLALAGCIAALIVIIRALIIKVDAPTGREITSDEAPALFTAIDDVIQRMASKGKDGKTRSAVVNAVRLDAAFDSKLHQVSRRGVFGKFENHLQLGVPLLAALTIAELKALLAHEIGHLGGQDTFAGWIYRQRIVWHALRSKFEKPSTLTERIMAAFYCWYADYFYAYSFVVARKLEYAADREAAKATHPGALANALTKIVLIRRFLAHDFWPRLMEQVEKSAEPPYLPYSMMPRAFGLARKQWSRQDWLDKSLREFAAEGDTHPSLSERFAALNIQPAPPVYSPERSSLSLFGADGAAILKWCDEYWQRENGAAWRKRHNTIKELRWKIAEYEKTPAADLQPEDLWQKILLILDLGHEGNAIDELQLLVTRAPSMAQAHLLLGKLLLQQGNERGLEHLGLAARHDEQMAEDAGRAGFDYLLGRGRKREAQRFWDRLCAA
jgi:hypothetical protein